MRILYYFKEKDVVMDQWQRAHIFHELAQYQIQIDVFNPLKYADYPAANDELLNYLRENPDYDLFMTPHGKEELFVETLNLIKQMGIPTLIIAFDNLLAPYMHQGIAEHFDLVWLTSHETKNIFDQWGAKSIIQPYAANPFMYRPRWNKAVHRTVFVGTPYGSRTNMINTLTENGVEVSLYGNFKFPKKEHIDSPINILNKPMDERFEALVPKTRVEFDWHQNNAVSAKEHTPVASLDVHFNSIKNLVKFPVGRKVLQGAFKQKLQGNSDLIENDAIFVHGPIPTDSINHVYSNFALSLASSGARSTGVLKYPVFIVNLRSFEIPMSGGLQFSPYYMELADYFEDEKEIVFYQHDDEFIEKANYYSHPNQTAEVLQMKVAAYKRALSDHTWASRFKNIFEELGIKHPL